MDERQPIVDIEHPQPGAVVLRLLGEHDAANAGSIAEQVDDALAHSLHVLIDLRRTLFVDSRIVATLLGAAATARAHERRLTLVMGTTPAVARVAELSGLTRAIETVDSVEEALALHGDGSGDGGSGGR